MSVPTYKQLYDAQGYVIIPALIPAGAFDELKAAAERTIERTRAGSWTHRRTVGRQFPPFDNDHPDSWGVQHVMHPDLGEPCFADWYTSSALVKVITELLDCAEDELQIGECPAFRATRINVVMKTLQSSLTCSLTR